VRHNPELKALADKGVHIAADGEKLTA